MKFVVFFQWKLLIPSFVAFFQMTDSTKLMYLNSTTLTEVHTEYISTFQTQIILLVDIASLFFQLNRVNAVT